MFHGLQDKAARVIQFMDFLSLRSIHFVNQNPLGFPLLPKLFRALDESMQFRNARLFTRVTIIVTSKVSVTRLALSIFGAPNLDR